MAIFKPNLDKLKQKRDIPGLIEACKYSKEATVRKGALQILHSLAKQSPEYRSETVLVTLSEALADEDYSVRLKSAEALVEIGDSSSTEPLIKALESADSEMEKTIIRALGNIADNRSIGHLKKMLKGGSRETINEIILAVKNSTPEEFLPLLIDLTKNENLRVTAIDVLGDYSDQRAVDTLVSMLYKKEIPRKLAAEKLEKMGWQPGNLKEKVIYLLAVEKWDEVAKIGDEALSVLYDSLDFRDRDIKEMAKLISRYGESAIDQLIIMTVVKDNAFRENVSDLMVAIGQPAAERLAIALQNQDFFIRNFASTALQRFGKKAIKYVLKQLKNPEGQVRLLAARILEEIGWEPHTELEKTYFYLAKSDWGKLGELNSCEHIIYALKHFDEKAAISSVLKRIENEDCILSLLDMLDNEEFSLAAKQGLLALGKSAVPYLSKDLLKKSNRYKLNAAVILGVIGEKTAVPALIELLGDEDKSIKMAAIISLGSIAEEGALSVLKEQVVSNDPAIRKVALDAIGDIYTVESTEILESLLYDPEPDIRKKAMVALAERGAGISALEGVMADMGDPLRKNAAFTLRIIGYIPEDIKLIVDFNLLNDIEIQEPKSVLRLREYLGDTQYSKKAREILIEIGDVQKVVPILESPDIAKRRDGYNVLLGIAENQAAIKGLGEHYLSDNMGNRFTGEVVQPLGKFVHITHDCPLCRETASKGRSLAFILDEILKRGYAAFPCNSCGSIVKIPAIIFNTDFLEEAKKVSHTMGNSEIGRFSYSEILVPNWFLVLHGYTRGEEVRPWTKDFLPEELAEVFMLFDGKPFAVKALVKKAEELWGTGTDISVHTATPADFLNVVKGYKEPYSFIKEHFGVDVPEYGEYHHKLFKIEGRMVFIIAHKT